MPETLHLSDSFKITVLSRIDLMDQHRDQLVKALSECSELVPTVYYYDDAGSKIFEEMCEEPSYYLPKVELRLLQKNSNEIARAIGCAHVVELGSGNSKKTKVLLLAFVEEFGEVLYQPIDVNQQVVETGGQDIVRDVPGVSIDALIGSYEEAISFLQGDPNEKVFLFLGSTMAQFTDEAVAVFLKMLRSTARPGDLFLVGYDLYKSPEVLSAPYNTPIADEHQWNGLKVMNRLFDGNFDTTTIRPSGRWNDDRKRIEMTLMFEKEQVVTFGKIGFQKTYPPGYETITHIMYKREAEDIVALMESNGLEISKVWRDPEIDYGLFLFSF